MTRDARRHEFTTVARGDFLAALAQGYTITAACAKIGFTRPCVYGYRKDDPQFAAEWDDAYERGSDYIEDEARRRAVEGVTKPVFYQGVVCGEVQEYSDTLMIAMLKARKPEKFRERFDHNVTGNIVVETVNFAKPDEDA